MLCWVWGFHAQLQAGVALSRVGSSCRSLNVDMEWLYGASESSNMEVDIGYLPQVCAPAAALRTQISAGPSAALALGYHRSWPRAAELPLGCSSAVPSADLLWPLQQPGSLWHCGLFLTVG